MKHYRIKLNELHHAKVDQVQDGYLAFGEGMGKWSKSICVYPRGEALKKANMFGGKIEAVELSKVITDLKVVMIPENALLHAVELLLEKQPTFNGMYKGDVFFTLLADANDLKDKTRHHLCELVQMVQGNDYVIITK